MTTAVHIFTHAGLYTAPVKGSSGRYSDDSLFCLTQPYLGADLLSCDTGSSDTSLAASAPTHTALANVQVQPGKRVHYEVTPAGHDLRSVTTSSPIIEGTTQLQFGPEWRISVLEVT